MHSEDMADQHRCCALIAERMTDDLGDHLLHAHAHRDVIRRYGRFPYRNQALGRDMTPEEKAFLDSGGYGRVVREARGEG